MRIIIILVIICLLSEAFAVDYACSPGENHCYDRSVDRENSQGVPIFNILMDNPKRLKNSWKDPDYHVWVNVDDATGLHYPPYCLPSDDCFYDAESIKNVRCSNGQLTCNFDKITFKWVPRYSFKISLLTLSVSVPNEYMSEVYLKVIDGLANKIASVSDDHDNLKGTMGILEYGFLVLSVGFTFIAALFWYTVMWGCTMGTQVATAVVKGEPVPEPILPAPPIQNLDLDSLARKFRNEGPGFDPWWN